MKVADVLYPQCEEGPVEFPVSTMTGLASCNWYVLNLSRNKKKIHLANEIQGGGAIKDEFCFSESLDDIAKG